MRRSRIALVGAGIVALVAVACSALPVPLSFQSQTPGTPAAVTTPGAPTEPGKPGGQVPGKPGGQAGGGVPVVTTPATTGDLGSSLTFNGTISTVQQTNLVPKTAGRIEKIFVDVGDRIKTGQTLVQLDRGTLDAAVKQAEANVQSAQARLATVQNGARNEDIEVARAQMNAARARLAAMEQGGRSEDIASGEAAVQSAQARLKQVQDGAKEADIKTAEQQIQAAQALFNKAVADFNKLKTPAPDELAAAKAQVDKTQATLQQAQSNYDKVGWRPDIAGRPESVALQQATADYQNALAQLRLRQSPREEDLAASQKGIDSARAQLDATKARLDQLKSGSTTEDLQIATSTLIQAQQTLAKARQPFTEQDIEAQRQVVLQAQQTLSLRSSPYTESDFQTARAQVAQAQAQLESARVAALEGAIVAPYDGFVTARPLAEGALTNPTTPAISIASTQIEVVLNVEEARIGDVKPGQPATIVVPAYPGKIFPAKIASLAPSADVRTHTFPVKVRPEPLDPLLMAGMFAEVKVTTNQRSGVVVVPREAVVQRSGKAYVYVVENGRARQVEVSGGLQSDKLAEIPSGVKPDDQVIVQGQATINDGDAVRIANAGGAGGPGGTRPGAPGKPEGGAGAPGKPEGAKPQGGRPADVGAGTSGKPEGGTGASGKPEGGAGASGKPEGGTGPSGKPQGGPGAAGKPEDVKPAGSPPAGPAAAATPAG